MGDSVYVACTCDFAAKRKRYWDRRTLDGRGRGVYSLRCTGAKIETQIYMMRGKLKSLVVISITLAAISITAPVGVAQQGGSPPLPDVVLDNRHDISPPLLSIPVRPPRAAVNKELKRHVPLDLIDRHRPSTPVQDPLQQTSGAATGADPTPLAAASFDGLSDDDNATTVGFRVVPPDTEGDVGPNHYVQMINSIFAIYGKTGGRLYGPASNDTLWNGFGGICETNNDGDPIVLYDHLADRWVFSQFALGTDGFQCFAISQTGDPLGSYYRYQFKVTTSGTNDYPKIGVWPNGYYYTTNEFSGGGSFRGAAAVAFERDKMLAGQAARMVKFGPLSCGVECFFSLQPSDLDGPAPPAGTPNTFLMAFDSETWGSAGAADGYRLWNFSADWAANSFSFTPIGQVNTTEFDSELCNFSRACIPQPSPGEKLDTLGQFTMYRAQFRQFGSESRLLVNHTVDASGSSLAGIRWAELRNSGFGWTLFQTGTYAPSDGLHRWMGSIAMDKVGNIALGYSASGPNSGQQPSIHYNTRTTGDPLGTLPGGEVFLIQGAGVQQSSFNRWGDYATMSVDPDGCTFWFTTEYYANNGSFDFKTRIGSFGPLAGCTSGGGTTPVHDVAVTSVTAPASVTQGRSATIGVAVANLGNQLESAVTVTATDTPPGGGTAGSLSCPGAFALAAGASTTVNCTWNTTGATTGTHTISATASITTGDVPGNNSGSTTSSVTSSGGGTTMHVGDLDGSKTSQGRNNWTALVTITMHNASHGLVSGATVSGSWSAGASGTASCTTNGTGKCTVSKGGLKKANIPSVAFTVTGATHATLTYSVADNHEPDGDSTGTSITVLKP